MNGKQLILSIITIISLLGVSMTVLLTSKDNTVTVAIIFIVAIVAVYACIMIFDHKESVLSQNLIQELRKHDDTIHEMSRLKDEICNIVSMNKGK